RHKGRGNWQLSGGQAESFTCKLFAYTFHFVEHLAGLNFCDPEFRIAFTITHTDFGRLLRNRLIGEDTDPDTAATFDVTIDRTTSSFDLASGQAATTRGFQTKFAKRYLRTASGQAGIAAFMLFAVFSA